jgi:hypothetical protein
MAQLPTGATFYIASAFGSALTVSALTNASEAVATSTAHGLSNGDIVEITSGWGRINKRTARVKSVATNTFTLEGIETSNTSFFPAGTGIGSVRKATTFTQVVNVMNPQNSGGDPRNVSYRFIESDIDYSINDGFTASSYTLEIDADTIGQAGYTALKTLTDAQSDTILLIQTRNLAKIYQPCTVALNENVRMQEGQINRCVAAFNGTNRSTRYSS